MDLPDLGSGWFTVLAAGVGAVATVVAAVFGRRNEKHRKIDETREEVERLVQMFRILESEKRELIQILAYFEGRCSHADCPNYPARLGPHTGRLS